MENNQFNPQAGQPNPMGQQGQPMQGQQPMGQQPQPQQGQPMGQQSQPMQGQQPMGQRPTQPQQGQPMGQQPQQGQPMGQRPTQPQQGQPMGQRPTQPQQGQPMGQQPQPMQGQQPMGQRPAQPMQGQPMPQAAPKAPMSMEKRLSLLAFSIVALYLLNRMTSSNFTHYFDKNHTLDTINDFFYSFYSAFSIIPSYAMLVIGALLFVPKWNKYFADYANARITLILLAGTEIALAVISYIGLIVTTVKTAGKYSGAAAEYAPNMFSWDFIFIPLLIAASVVVLILALKLQNNKLKKDRYITGLGITSITLVSTGLICLMLSLLA